MNFLYSPEIECKLRKSGGATHLHGYNPRISDNLVRSPGIICVCKVNNIKNKSIPNSNRMENKVLWESVVF